MNSLQVISSPWSEPWVAWTMLGLLVLVGIAHGMQPQAITMGFRSLFSAGDRNSTFIDTALDKRAQAIMLFFAVCTLSMATYISVFAWTRGHVFSFTNYGIIILFATGLLLIRTVLEAFAGFTFVSRSGIDAFIDHYYHLTVCTALVLYPVVILSLFWSALTPAIIVILNATIIAFYLIILLVKSCSILVHSVRGFFYILLYIITLEILPIVALVGFTVYSL